MSAMAIKLLQLETRGWHFREIQSSLFLKQKRHCCSATHTLLLLLRSSAWQHLPKRETAADSRGFVVCGERERKNGEHIFSYVWSLLREREREKKWKNQRDIFTCSSGILREKERIKRILSHTLVACREREKEGKTNIFASLNAIRTPRTFNVNVLIPNSAYLSLA